MEIKYEAVFGDQSLFDGAEPDVFLVETNGVYKTFHKETSGRVTIWTRNGCDLAMRRIIHEPKHWTWADKEAGRLPEVGSNAQYINQGIVVEVLAIKNGWIVVVNVDGTNREPFILPSSGFIKYYNPIETQKEKAKRERAEWAKQASQFIDDELDCVNLVGEHVMRRFYNAMLSGDLPVPVALEQNK